MKKTINISLGGSVFHIEEDAHQKLSSYLDAISGSLHGSEGHSEIMADIESRIGELLQPHLNSFNQVITLAHIEEVINIMGSPDEFSPGNAGSVKDEGLNTGGKGRYQYGQRRIFRDPDDKVLGGVCSGLAYHFGFDPIWLRLAFGLSIFLGGFGFILYLLLLIIIPKAHTAAEKLEMRGEPVDINNIRKIIEDDLRDFKKRAKDFGNDMKNWKTGSRSNQFRRNAGDFFASLGNRLGNLAGGILKGILAFIGFVLVLVLTITLVALVASLWSGLDIVHIQSHNGHIIHYSVHSLFTMFDIAGAQRTTLVTGIFLFIGIPLIALIIRFGRAVMGVRKSPRWLNLFLSFGWFTSWVLLFSVAVVTFRHFSAKATVSDEIKFSMPSSSSVLFLKMPPDNDEDASLSVDIDSLNFYVSDDAVFRGNPSLCIVESPDSNFHLLLNKSAKGKNEAEAKETAANIEYSFAQHDSLLLLNRYYCLPDGAPWRRQKVEATLQIPLNKTINMPEGIDHILCYTLHRKHHHLGGYAWTMTQDGLKSLSLRP